MGGIGQMQCAVTCGIGAAEIQPHHLPENRLPLPPAVIATHAESRQLVMAPGADLLGRVAGQDIDQMPGPEPFPGPHYRR